MQLPIITLITDFGEQDAYVGAMKGVLLSIAPGAQLVDITHQIERQNVRQAASILADVYLYYPPHTVHVVVVDPGVGSQRQPIVLGTPHGIFVAPDNGVLTHVRSRERETTAVLLDNPQFWLPSPSITFHGRDIFVPVAAHIAMGTPLQELGTPLDDILTLELPQLTITPTSIQGEVTGVDHFGNVLTSIMRLRWIDAHTLEFTPADAASSRLAPTSFDARQARVVCGWHTVTGIQQTYSAANVGQPMALVGSGGELEIAVNQGSASEMFAIQVGAPVMLRIS